MVFIETKPDIQFILSPEDLRPPMFQPIITRGIQLDVFTADNPKEIEMFSTCIAPHGEDRHTEDIYYTNNVAANNISSMLSRIDIHLAHYPGHLGHLSVIAFLLPN